MMLLRTFNNIRKNPEGKTLLSNLGYLSLLEISTRFFPLITIPYLARVIGLDGFGALAIGGAVITYFQTIVTYGFNYTSVRDIARCREDINKVSLIVNRTFATKIFLSLLSFIIVLFLIILIPFFHKYWLVILCSFAVIPGSVLYADWFFQAYEKMKYVTILSIASRLIFTILVFLIIKMKGDYYLKPILTGISYLIPAIITLIIMKFKYNVSFYITTFSDIIKELRKGWNLFVASFLPSIYSNLNILVLGSCGGQYATGVFNGGIKFTSIAFGAFQVLSRTFFPFFSRKLDKHRLYAMLSLGLAIFMSLFLFVFAEDLILLFLGDEFRDSINVLRILSLSPIAMSLMNSYGFNYLVLRGKEKLMKNIMVFVTVIGVVVGVCLAYYYSFIGVAIAEVLIQFLRALLMMFFALKIKNKIVRVSEVSV